MFVLYKVSALHYASEDADGSDLLFSFCPKLVRLSLEVLMKTQSDDVRLNCIGLYFILFYFVPQNLGSSVYLPRIQSTVHETSKFVCLLVHFFSNL